MPIKLQVLRQTVGLHLSTEKTQYDFKTLIKKKKDYIIRP